MFFPAYYVTLKSFCFERVGALLVVLADTGVLPLFFGDGSPMFFPMLFIGEAGLSHVGGVRGACVLGHIED